MSDFKEIKTAMRARVHCLSVMERMETGDITSVLEVIAKADPNSSVSLSLLRSLCYLFFPEISHDRVMAVAVVTAFPNSYIRANPEDGRTEFAGVSVFDPVVLAVEVAKRIKKPRNLCQSRARYCATVDWSQFPKLHRQVYELYALHFLRPPTVGKALAVWEPKVRNIISYHNMQATAEVMS